MPVREVADGHEQMLILERHAKVDAALYAVTPYPVLPEYLSLGVRIEAVYNPMLLAGEQHLFASRQLVENGAGGDVDVRAVFRRTVRIVLHHAGNVPGVAGQH